MAVYVSLRCKFALGLSVNVHVTGTDHQHALAGLLSGGGKGRVVGILGVWLILLINRVSSSATSDPQDSLRPSALRRLRTACNAAKHLGLLPALAFIKPEFSFEGIDSFCTFRVTRARSEDRCSGYTEFGEIIWSNHYVSYRHSRKCTR